MKILFVRILKEGFKIGGQNGHPASHGAALGFGVYTAADPSVSIVISHSFLNYLN